MKIIFLDVDGELTYSNYLNKETENIDMNKVMLLKKICDNTDAKVVISSSWRGTKDWTPDFYYVLINILKSVGIEVIGDLPYITPEFIDSEIGASQSFTLEVLPEMKLKHGTGRAAEVEKWLNENDVESFVILDDEDYDWCEYGYEERWIRPTWFGDGGLKDHHVKLAIEILNYMQM